MARIDVARDLLPILNGTDRAEMSRIYQAEDGTIHVGLHPPVTQADLCAVADLVSDELDLPVVVEEKSVEAVTG